MKSPITAQRLAQALDEKKLLPSELAAKSGVSKSSISQYMNGTHAPSNISSAKMAKVLDVDPLWLMGFDVPMKKLPPVSYPLYEAAAGEGRINDGYPSDEYRFELEGDEEVIRVCGQSMEPTLQDGDLVIVSPTSIPDHPHQICLVQINGDAVTLKRVEIRDDGITLVGDNVRDYAPHFFTPEQVEGLPVRILGVVRRLIREL